jgi:SNF2 family DNA or RNA helicase
MFKDIELIPHTKVVRFHKVMFGESEISLAKCLCFDFVEEGGKMVIEANLYKTRKEALNNFIKTSFSVFYHSDADRAYRESLFCRLKECYDAIYQEFTEQHLSKLPYHDKFYWHQSHGLSECYWKQHNFLAFEMQLGKSITAISLSLLDKSKRTLIICPVVSKWKWMNDMVDTFGFNSLMFTILDSSKKGSVKAFQERYVLVNFDILKQKMDEILSKPIDHIIIDESQAVKNYHSQRSKNIMHIIEENPNARITFLSGTPIENRVNDLFAYFKMIQHELGKNYSLFLREFTTSKHTRRGDKITGGRNLESLRMRISNFMIRRRRKDCLDVPESIIEKYYFELGEYENQYNEIVEAMIKDGTAGNLDSNLTSLNRVTATSKVKGIIEIADTIIESGEKVIIFASYTKPLEMLEEYYGDRCVVIRGGVAAHERTERAKRFKDDPNCNVLLGNTVAAGVSLSLQFCSNVIHVNFTFTHSKMDQASGRVQGMGQTKAANIIYTIAKDSIDEIIYDLVVSKAKDADAVIDGGSGNIDFDNIPNKLLNELLIRHGKQTNTGTEVTGSDRESEHLADAGQGIPHVA